MNEIRGNKRVFARKDGKIYEIVRYNTETGVISAWETGSTSKPYSFYGKLDARQLSFREEPLQFWGGVRGDVVEYLVRLGVDCLEYVPEEMAERLKYIEKDYETLLVHLQAIEQGIWTNTDDSVEFLSLNTVRHHLISDPTDGGEQLVDDTGELAHVCSRALIGSDGLPRRDNIERLRKAGFTVHAITTRGGDENWIQGLVRTSKCDIIFG